MSKKRKVIENYQMVEILEVCQDEYEIILAKHIIENKNYILKKIVIKEEGKTDSYEKLLNEATVLKMIKHDNITKCIKMLKTSSNLYIVYNYLQGVTFSQLMEKAYKKLTFVEKEGIIKQIFLALIEVHNSGIAILNLNPENITISSEFNILIRELMYGCQIPEEGQIEIKRKIPKTQFVAPEVRKGIATYQSDIYSFGKILEFMKLKKCKKGNQESQNYEQQRIVDYDYIIENSVVKDRNARITLKEIYQTIFKKKRKVKRLRSLSAMESSIYSSRSLSSTKSAFGSKKSYEEIILKILKIRNQSWFLIKLFKACAVDLAIQNEKSTILGFLLLKKSTKIISSLGKYLHYGKNEIGVEITIKQQSKFFKTVDYFKLKDIVDLEITSQKKEFDSAVELIYLHHGPLLKIPQFNIELKIQYIADDYFMKSILDFLIMVVSNQTLMANMTQQSASNLYLLSHIYAYKGVEEFFKVRILTEPVNLEEQLYIKKAREMNKSILIDSIYQTIGKMKID